MSNLETKNYESNLQIKPSLIWNTVENKADQLNSTLNWELSKEAKLEINIAWSLLERFYWVNNLKRKAELHNKNIWDYWDPYNKLKWNIISWTLIEA
jgi:hypothetical protein